MTGLFQLESVEQERLASPAYSQEFCICVKPVHVVVSLNFVILGGTFYRRTAPSCGKYSVERHWESWILTRQCSNPQCAPFYDNILFCVLSSLHLLSFRICRVGGNKYLEVQIEMFLIQDNTVLLVLTVFLKQTTKQLFTCKKYFIIIWRGWKMITNHFNWSYPVT